ncbi:hypothetical protein PRIPAC_95544, partial [Pristionchus pacificus]|uniref:Uncharacterized protein n=1 Tax=Pristionchus pacificus TaxID=54126 RepID=A0A2A6BIS7_PRIPA
GQVTAYKSTWLGSDITSTRMNSAYLTAFLLLATALLAMGADPAVNADAAAAGQTPAGSGKGMVMDMVNKFVDSVQGVPVLGPLANAAKAFPQMIVDMALRIASTFIGQSGLIATIPGAAQFVAPLNDLAVQFLGKPEAAQSAPAQ